MAALMIGAGVGALAGPAAAFGQPAPVTPGTPGASTTPAGRAVPVRPIPPGIFAGSLREDAVASAQPTAEQPDVTDTQSADLTMISPGKANTVATGSATCDGCAAAASVTATIRMVFTSGPARADNVATAWAAGCRNCTASAVSVQIVAATTDDAQVTNRALAVNAGCVGCTSTAVAVQYVLLGVKSSRLSPSAAASARADGEHLAARLDTTTRSAAPDAGRAAIADAAEQNRVTLQQLFGAASARVTVDYRTG